MNWEILLLFVGSGLCAMVLAVIVAWLFERVLKRLDLPS